MVNGRPLYQVWVAPACPILYYSILYYGFMIWGCHLGGENEFQKIKNQHAFWIVPEYRPSQDQPTEMLSNDLKTVFHTRYLKHLSELKKFCEEECFRILPDHCTDLVCSYQKHLFKVIVAMGVLTSY